MDLDDGDVRLLNQIRQERSFRARERWIHGLLTLFFSGAAVVCLSLTPSIPDSPLPELDVAFELLRWQARSTSSTNRRDALILKLIERRGRA